VSDTAPNAPKCPFCGRELRELQEKHEAVYEYHGDMYAEKPDYTWTSIKCVNCDEDVSDLFPDGVLNYDVAFHQAAEILEEVSDETGEEEFGNGFLLKYEGWSPTCFPKNLPESEYESYAEDKTEEILKEWKRDLAKRGYYFLDGGYLRSGLYGVTWALFVLTSYPVESSISVISYRCPKCGSNSVEVIMSATEAKKYDAYLVLRDTKTVDQAFEEAHCNDCGYESMDEEEWRV